MDSEEKSRKDRQMEMMESAIAIISGADRQLEITAQNVGNVNTPAYKARQPFWTLVNPQVSTVDQATELRSGTDFTQGKISTTGNPYDLSLGSEGFFVVRDGSAVHYTRNGQFERDDEGRLVTGEGFAVQSDAGDVVLRTQNVEILSDGTVLDDGQPVARILVKAFAAPAAALTPVGASAFAAADVELAGAEVFDPDIRQGTLEMSNVSMAHETLAMMKALRLAESGQRITQLYDDLMGQAISSFGQTQA